MEIFNNKKTLAIDFGSSNIKLVEGRFSKKGIIINKYFTIPLPRDLYRNGEILNIHGLSSLLERHLKENTISATRVIGVINSSNIITREITIPKVSFEEIESLLRYQIEDYIPINQEDYIVQSLALDTFYEDGVEKLNLLLIGVPKSMVEAHLGLLTNMNLKPQALDFQANSINKLIKFNDNINGIHSTREVNLAAVDIGFNNTKLTLISDGNIKLSRVLDWGSRSIVDKLSRELGISFEQAEEEILKIQTIGEDTGAEGQIVDLIKSEINNLNQQLEMIFRYYRNRDSRSEVDLILLYGGISHIDGLSNMFSSFFNLATISLDSLDKLKFDGSLLSYSNAIGGLIRMDGVKL